MFKITKTANWKAAQSAAQFVAPDPDLIAHFCQFEDWSADLATGVFRFGAKAREMHGLPDEGDCGLLNLIRCYEADDRRHVLELFETAAMGSSSFCYSTTVVHDDGTLRPLMCIGESVHYSDEGGGSITGLFIFPCFHLPQTKNRSQAS